MPPAENFPFPYSDDAPTPMLQPPQSARVGFRALGPVPERAVVLNALALSLDLQIESIDRVPIVVVHPLLGFDWRKPCVVVAEASPGLTGRLGSPIRQPS